MVIIYVIYTYALLLVEHHCNVAGKLDTCIEVTVDIKARDHQRVGRQLSVAADNDHIVLRLGEVPPGMRGAHHIIARNDWRKEENTIDVSLGASDFTLIRLQFNINVTCTAAGGQRHLARYAEALENEIHIFALTAHVILAVEIEFNVLGLEAPTRRRGYAQQILAFIVDGQKIISIRR